MMSEEAQNVLLVPHVDAVFLLVAGGAEGGAGPRSFGEEGVVTQRAWGGAIISFNCFMTSCNNQPIKYI